VRRGEFITISAMVARPSVVCAQQPAKIARIGYLGLGSASAYANLVEGLRTALRDLGYVEGKNIVIEFRGGNGRGDAETRGRVGRHEC
jgi:putative ABC transport system substrate-binding protein